MQMSSCDNGDDKHQWNNKSDTNLIINYNY